MVCFDYAEVRNYYLPNLNLNVETSNENFELKFSAMGNLLSY